MNRITEQPTIALLDNDPITLDGLSHLVEREQLGAVIWATSSARQAIRDCCDPSSRPDLLITDMSMRPISGREVCLKIRRRLAHPAILAITSFPLTVYAQEASIAGAQGIVSKADAATLANAARVISAGGTWGSGFEPAALAHVRLASQTKDANALSARESEAVNLLSQGYSIVVVAARMNVTESAVKSYIARAKAKLGAASLRSLIATWTGDDR